MEGTHHATPDAYNDKPTLRRDQMAADLDGTPLPSRRSPRRRCNGPVGITGDVASPQGDVAVNAQGSRGHSSGPRVIDSKALMDGARTILITHEGQEYTLRLTRLGKLLLTK